MNRSEKFECEFVRYFLPRTEFKSRNWQKSRIHLSSEGIGYRADLHTLLVLKEQRLKRVGELAVPREGAVVVAGVWEGTVVVAVVILGVAGIALPFAGSL